MKKILFIILFFFSLNSTAQSVYTIVNNGAIISVFSFPQNAPTPTGYTVMLTTDARYVAWLLTQAQAMQIVTVLQPAYQAAIIAPISYTTKVGAVAGVYAADTGTQQFFQIVAQGNVGASALATFTIYTTSNVAVPMTLADLNAMIALYATQYHTAYARYNADVAMINAASTVSAVQAISW
jgi:hypothetical protein